MTFNFTKNTKTVHSLQKQFYSKIFNTHILVEIEKDCSSRLAFRRCRNQKSFNQITVISAGLT
jgi:hypothetical protein